MSKFTTEVRFICENYAGNTMSQEYPEIDDIVKEARSRIFEGYPIYDEEHREELECKILKHYYTREICAETVGLWKLWLNNRMNEIMPYYNELYKTLDLEYDILTDTDYHNDGVESSGTINGGSDVQNYSKNDKENTWDLFSDTPQGGINGIRDAEDEPALSTNAYLTNARHIIGDTNGSSGNTTTNYGRTVNSSGNSNSHVYGKMPGKSYMNLIKEYRDNIINIDQQIIYSLSDLFFNLWE